MYEESRPCECPQTMIQKRGERTVHPVGPTPAFGVEKGCIPDCELARADHDLQTRPNQRGTCAQANE